MPRRSAVQPPKPPPAKPFLKWVGGKRQLLPFLLEHKPKTFGTYHEPFVGGGALYFALAPREAVLSDTNKRLVQTYQAVKEKVDDLIAQLKKADDDHNKEYFLKVREQNIDDASIVDVAAWFIYLNKTAYNGMYRVNRSNKYNVPFGQMKSPLICDEETLRACSIRLQGTQVQEDDFRAVELRAKPGDFVYFDPPYIPLSATAKFDGYTKDGFGDKDQMDLRNLALRLKKKKVRVLLSNSSHPKVRKLYQAPDFKVLEVPARRNVNAQGGGRGAITELLIK